MEVLMLNEDYLTENLSGESKKKFLDFVNAWSVVNGESNLDSFIMGFRLGADFTYNRLQAEFKLNSYLYDINSQAEEMFETLTKQFKLTEGITEQLKSENQMEWVRRMNNIRQIAAEIVIIELIYNWNTKMSEA